MQVVVIGAGIVGLHVARVFAEKGNDVFVLDKEAYVGHHTSTRNTGVIHAGLYYKHGSLKECLCIDGNRKTYEWLDKLGVPYVRRGKLVLPAKGQEGDLDEFEAHLRELNIEKPQRLTVAKITELEPGVKGREGFFVPSTGVMDTSAYLNAMARYIEKLGAMVVLNCKVTGIEGGVLHTDRDDIPFDLCINSAGLSADEVAAMNGVNGYEIRACRGDYYLSRKCPITRPIYHLPSAGRGGLGVHLTPTLEKEMLIGPNDYFIGEKEGYEHRSEIKEFEESVEYYLNAGGTSPLIQAYTGNRPKLFKNGAPVSDYEIVKNGNVVHLLGIESPGLTAAPALAEELVAGH